MGETLEAKPVKKKSMKLAWIFLLFAAAYVISPVDLIPDAPIIGWIDDAIVALLAILNFIRKYLKR